MEHVFDLDQTFNHKTTTHEYQVKWTRFGNTTAPPLVLIHGTPWSSASWKQLATSLSFRYNVYVYDHPGFGVSPAPHRLQDVTDQDTIDLDGSLVLRAEASAALLHHWKLASPPHVVAHDNGGLVSLRLLLQRGIEFASLCLIDVVALGPFGLPLFKLVAENEGVFQAIPLNFIEGLLRSYVKSATCKPLPEQIENMLCAPWLEGGMHGCKNFLREMVQGHHRETGAIEDQYASVGGKTPTKIIWGKDDAWILSETAQRLGRALHAQEVVVIEEAGHLVQYDQPSKLAVEVGLWLREHSKT